MLLLSPHTGTALMFAALAAGAVKGRVTYSDDPLPLPPDGGLGPQLWDVDALPSAYSVLLDHFARRGDATPGDSS